MHHLRTQEKMRMIKEGDEEAHEMDICNPEWNSEAYSSGRSRTLKYVYGWQRASRKMNKEGDYLIYVGNMCSNRRVV